VQNLRRADNRDAVDPPRTKGDAMRQRETKTSASQALLADILPEKQGRKVSGGKCKE